VLAYSGVAKDTAPGMTYFGIPAEEARKKWKEIASMKALPELLAKLNKGQ
jgi:UDP-3-O-[3-hydroxymyristoyl] glucosamine N-acyltransferase